MRMHSLHIIDGVGRFTQHYFQLGFIHKEQFSRRLRNNHRSVSVFLVVSILSISARLSPLLSTRYGSSIKAAKFFMDRAEAIARDEINKQPITLERCQAFYLLSIAQQGSGLGNQSHMNMGCALRMATGLQLHLEQTYYVPEPTRDTIIRAESARRTLWMIYSQDQLHSSSSSPTSLAASDITTLLPCDEDTFADGQEPPSRAALEGTPPAIDDNKLVYGPHRSLFASLLQAHDFWGIVSRRASRFALWSYPWDQNSEFLKNKICMLMGSPGYRERPQVYVGIVHKLFDNVHRLYEQIDAQFTDRSPDESVGAQMAAFCVYSCGLFSIYLCHYPKVCPEFSQYGPMIFQGTLSILNDCKKVWPLASRWVVALERFAQDPTNPLIIQSENGMADSKDPIPHPLVDPSTYDSVSSGISPSSSLYSRPGNYPGSSSAMPSSSSHDILTPVAVNHVGSSHFPLPQIQHQAPPYQLHPDHHLHQQPQSGMLQPQAYIPHQMHRHLYMDPSDSTNLGMAMGHFHHSTAQSYSMGPYGNHPLTVNITATTVMPPAPFNPSVEGYEGELSFFLNGPQDWMSANSLFDGYY
ncbi:hypothetical protein F66182_6237 [Fusarium sp. NRRL 66182]|nr:hypothetical protein F66182_6237 [Fusarium sp. NRRL 66182]